MDGGGPGHRELALQKKKKVSVSRLTEGDLNLPSPEATSQYKPAGKRRGGGHVCVCVCIPCVYVRLPVFSIV